MQQRTPRRRPVEFMRVAGCSRVATDAAGLNLKLDRPSSDINRFGDRAGRDRDYHAEADRLNAIFPLGLGGKNRLAEPVKALVLGSLVGCDRRR